MYNLINMNLSNIKFGKTGAALRISLLAFFFSILYLMETKPDFMFNKDGTPKQFGLKKNETTFTLVNVSTMLAIMILIIVH